MTMSLAVVGIGIVSGAMAQRLTGIGFSLVATPFVVIALGPWDALGVIHSAGLAVCVVLAVTQRQLVDWNRMLRITGWCVVAIGPATILAWSIDPAILELVIGCSLCAALLATSVAGRVAFVDSRGLRAFAGLTIGVVTAVGAAGGPLAALYARLVNWRQRDFAATAQAIFVVTSISALAARRVVAGGAFPVMPMTVWLLVGVSLPLGIALGAWVARYVSEQRASTATMSLAIMGGAMMIVRAASSMAQG